jgi:hypothetical protein
VSSIKPDNGGSKIDCPEECFGPFVVSGCNASELLEFGEEVFNPVPGFIQVRIICALVLPVFLWRYDRLDPGILQQLQHAFRRVIRLVSQQRLRAGEQRGQQRSGPVQIAGLAGRQGKARRMAQRIAGRLDFRGQSPVATPEALCCRGPPFAPAVC